MDRPITGFVVKSDSSHKTITKQEDGSKNYKFEKDFNFEKFKHNIEEKLNFSSLLAGENYSLMNKKEFEKEIRKRDERLKILEERQKIINKEKQKIIREQQEIEEKIINDFRERIKIDFNIKEEEFNKKLVVLPK